jgi:hypothetical protein
MESKSEKKTKAQIERDTPFIRPEECPGAIIDWVQKRDADNHTLWLGMLRKELLPIKRFIRIAATNRIWLIGLTAVVTALVIIVWVHLTQLG